MASGWQENSIDLTSAPKLGAVTYFVQASHGGPIKIGRSTKAGLKSRVASIQTGCPYPLVVTRTMDGDYEADLHEQFADHRLHGEWFSPARELALFSGAKLEEGESATHTQATLEAGYEAGYDLGREHAGRDLQHDLKQVGEQIRLLGRQIEFPDRATQDGHVRELRQAFKRFMRDR